MAYSEQDSDYQRYPDYVETATQVVKEEELTQRFGVKNFLFRSFHYFDTVGDEKVDVIRFSSTFADWKRERMLEAFSSGNNRLFVQIGSYSMQEVEYLAQGEEQETDTYAMALPHGQERVIAQNIAKRWRSIGVLAKKTAFAEKTAQQGNL